MTDFNGNPFVGFNQDVSNLDEISGAITVDDTGVVTIDKLNIGTSLTPAKASLIHSHDASEVTTGVFADARISQSSVVQHNSALVHQSLSGAGVYDHSAIDSHIDDLSKHRVINDAGTTTTDLWSANKINTELGLKANSSHTHTSADVTDFASAADARITAQKAQINGLATLNGDGKVPSAQLPSIAVTTVTVVADIAARDALTPSTGDVAKVTSNGVSYIWDGSAWQELTSPSAVDSVNGLTGAVTLTTTNITEGTNLYYTTTRANTDITNRIDDITPSSTNLYSSSKIDTELLTKANSSHTHVAADVTDFNTAADARISLQKGAANGLATLGADSKITPSQLPILSFDKLTTDQRDILTPTEGDTIYNTDTEQIETYTNSSWRTNNQRTPQKQIPATTQTLGITNGIRTSPRLKEFETDNQEIYVYIVGNNFYYTLDGFKTSATVKDGVGADFTYDVKGSSATDYYMWIHTNLGNGKILWQSRVHNTNDMDDLIVTQFSFDGQVKHLGAVQVLDTGAVAPDEVPEYFTLPFVPYDGKWVAVDSSPSLCVYDGTTLSTYSAPSGGSLVLYKNNLALSSTNTVWFGNTIAGLDSIVWDAGNPIGPPAGSSFTAHNANSFNKFASGNGIFVTSAYGGGVGEVWWSSDLINWNMSLTIPSGVAAIQQVAFVHGFFVVMVAGEQNYIGDGKQWMPINGSNVISAVEGDGCVNFLGAGAFKLELPLYSSSVIEAQNISFTNAEGDHISADMIESVDCMSRSITSNNIHVQDINIDGNIIAPILTTAFAGKADLVHFHDAADVNTGVFADARISQSSVTQHNSALVHQTLSGAGSNTHAQIDTHISDLSKHRTINDSGSSSTDLWSASKISSEIKSFSRFRITSGTTYNADASGLIIVDSNAPVTITLPVLGIDSGGTPVYDTTFKRTYNIVNNSIHPCEVKCAASLYDQILDGTSIIIDQQYDSVTLKNDELRWVLI